MPQRDTLMNLDVVPDGCGFANDHARAVIDEKAAPSCARMNINAGQRVACSVIMRGNNGTSSL